MTESDAGFTVLEVLVGLAIATLLAGLLVTFAFQVMTVGNAGNDRLLVTDDLRSAGSWLTQDAQMADMATSSAMGSSLMLSWTDAYSGANTGYQVRYQVAGSELTRAYGSRGSVPVTTTVARHIGSPGDVDFRLGGGLLTATITVTSGPVREGQQFVVSGRVR